MMRPEIALLLLALVPFLALAGGCFPHGAADGLEHFPAAAPAVGGPVPDVVLLDLEGRPVRLADHLGGRPVVLQLGSATCPVFRYRRHWIERLARRYGERVGFVVVYTREAHPVGSASPYRRGGGLVGDGGGLVEEGGEEAVWDPWINRIAGVRLDEPADADERRRRAAAVAARLELPMTVLVDPEGDPAWRAFGRAPSPAFVVGADGRVVAAQAWVEPGELRRVLDGLVAR